MLGEFVGFGAGVSASDGGAQRFAGVIVFAAQFGFGLFVVRRLPLLADVGDLRQRVVDFGCAGLQRFCAEGRPVRAGDGGERIDAYYLCLKVRQWGVCGRIGGGVFGGDDGDEQAQAGNLHRHGVDVLRVKLARDDVAG